MTSLSIPVNILLVLLSAVLGFLEHRRLLRKDPSLTVKTVHGVARYLPLLVVVLAIVIAFQLIPAGNLRIWWHLPAWVQLRGAAVAWGVLLVTLTFLFTLGVSFVWRDGHPRRHALLAVSVLLVCSLFYTQWKYYAPIAPYLQSWIDENGIVQQSSDVSCAAATGANIARRYGISITEKEMAEIMGTTRRGTLSVQVVLGLRHLGLETRPVQGEDGDLPCFDPPAVLFVDHPVAGAEGHAVGYLGREGDTFEIWDPLVGRRMYSAEDLLQIWHGHAIACPGPE